jgi:hypothetical protein
MFKNGFFWFSFDNLRHFSSKFSTLVTSQKNTFWCQTYFELVITSTMAPQFNIQYLKFEYYRFENGKNLNIIGLKMAKIQCSVEWVENGLFSKSHLYLWFSLNLIFSKNFCLLFFFPDLAKKPLKILWFGLKLTILAIFTRNAIFLMIFCLFRIESSLNSIKKTLEPKPWSWPYDREGHEKISIFDDLKGFLLIELRTDWLFHL